MNRFARQCAFLTMTAVVGLALIAEPSRAADGFAASGAKFLTVGGGARALAMAETYITESVDPFVVFYNPASLTDGGLTRLGLAHNEHFQNSDGEYLALAVPAGRWGLGLGLQYMAVNGIPKRIGPSADPLAEFDAADFLLQGSLSYRVAPKGWVGLTCKGVFEKIDTEVANGIALDLGGVYRVSESISLGAAFNHLGPELSFKNDSYKLPSEFHLGGAYTTAVWSARGEMVSPNNEAAHVHLGGEYVFPVPTEEAGISDASLAFRAGYIFGHDTRSWAAGFGIGLDRFVVDYAFVPYDDDLGNTHRFALRFELR